ncbi:MAG TPA: hypothetical protein VH643_25365, partial [Gemmataceae bacterium]
MGHIRLGALPRTRKWSQVVGLIEGGAGTAQIANATINAAEKGLRSAAKEDGVVETIWLLTKLPLAARSEDFAQALHDCGLSVSDAPGLMDIVGAVTDAIDARMPNCKGRTDLVVLSVTFEHSGSQIKQAGSEVLKLLPLRLLSHSRSDFFAEDFPLQCP